MYYESDWGSEEWTRGAYAASYDLGGLHRYGKDQLAPVGPIYWSCSDLAGRGLPACGRRRADGTRDSGPHPCGSVQRPAASWPVRPDGRARGVRRYVVAYTATDSGREAVNLATALARRQGGSLDLVMVLPESSPYSGAYPRPESGYDAILSDQIREWLAEGLSLVPDDVTARAHVRPAESNAEGLIAAAEEFGAALIVIGAGRNSVFRRFSVGTVASGLLHASTVPVALAPRGYRRTEPVTRITVGVGNRAGADDVLQRRPRRGPAARAGTAPALAGGPRFGRPGRRRHAPKPS